MPSRTLGSLRRWDLGLVVALLAGIAACEDTGATAPDAGAADARTTSEADAVPLGRPSCVETGDCVTVLASGTYEALSRSWPYQLLRLGKPDGSFAYAMWIPPTTGVPGPALLMANPYDGIDWSGDPTDARWASQNGQPGCYEDEDAPAYQLGTSAQTCYGGTQSPDASAAQAIGFLLNDVGTLIVFGRFYAGGTVTSYIDSMVAGLEYLSVHGQVDQSRVGVFGVSLGGFEAMHGAARAPDAIRPLRGVGMAPLLDFEAEATYVEDTLPGALLPNNATVLEGYTDFFDPYLRRAYATTGGPPGPASDFSAMNLTPLRAGLEGDYLVIHDSWDTLVPIGPSETLVAEHASVHGFWYPHATAIDFATFQREHQQPSEGQTFSVSMAFSYAFLLTRLGGPTGAPLVIYDWNELATFFTYVRAQQNGGHDLSWLVPRLLDLADARVLMHDVGTTDAGQAPGYHVVGLFLNAVWGAGLAEADFATSVVPFLQTMGLPAGN